MFAIAKWVFNAVGRALGHTLGGPWHRRSGRACRCSSLIIGVLDFALTPVSNTMIRVAEVEADAFALNCAREPTAAAQVALKLGTYRKLDPGPLEEFIFFDHPSGRERIRAAMDWKAAHSAGGGKLSAMGSARYFVSARLRCLSRAARESQPTPSFETATFTPETRSNRKPKRSR